MSISILAAISALQGYVPVVSILFEINSFYAMFKKIIIENLNQSRLFPFDKINMNKPASEDYYQ